MMSKWFDDNIDSDYRKNYYIPVKRVVDILGSGCKGETDLVQGGGFVCTKQAGEPTGIILDFGQELNGGIRIITGYPKDEWFAKIRIRFGESVSEVLTNPINDHAIHDQVLSVSSLGTHEFGDTGFRFVRIDFLDDEINFDIKHICAVAKELDLEYKGSFESSDELLNKIWLAGARTVHLCCQDYIYDGVKRDRLLWVGDLHPQIQVAKTVFGDIDVVKKTLLASPSTKLHTRWMNWGYCSYSLWWIICIWEWYYYTGDKSFISQTAEDVKFIAEQIDDCITADGAEKYDGQRFLDWPTAKDDGAISQGLMLLTSMAIDRIKLISDILSDNELEQKASAIKGRLNNALLTASSNVKQVNSLKSFAGVDCPVNPEEISMDGLSTWYGYYYIEHLAANGCTDKALGAIRDYWGGMLSLGATTFWEHFDLSWLENASRIDELPVDGKVDVHKEYGGFCFIGHRHSFCHGWAAGPTAWLSKNVLGVDFASAGCENPIIKPYLGDIEWVKGSIPTPDGVLTVEHKKTAKGIETQITD